jgi:hypothetical protein
MKVDFAVIGWLDRPGGPRHPVVVHYAPPRWWAPLARSVPWGDRQQLDRQETSLGPWLFFGKFRKHPAFQPAQNVSAYTKPAQTRDRWEDARGIGSKIAGARKRKGHCRFSSAPFCTSRSTDIDPASLLETSLLSFGNRWCQLRCGPPYLSVFAEPNKFPASSHLQESYHK